MYITTALSCDLIPSRRCPLNSGLEIVVVIDLVAVGSAEAIGTMDLADDVIAASAVAAVRKRLRTALRHPSGKAEVAAAVAPRAALEEAAVVVPLAGREADLAPEEWDLA